MIRLALLPALAAGFLFLSHSAGSAEGARLFLEITLLRSQALPDGEVWVADAAGSAIERFRVNGSTERLAQDIRVSSLSAPVSIHFTAWGPEPASPDAERQVYVEDRFNRVVPAEAWDEAAQKFRVRSTLTLVSLRERRKQDQEIFSGLLKAGDVAGAVAHFERYRRLYGLTRQSFRNWVDLAFAVRHARLNAIMGRDLFELSGFLRPGSEFVAIEDAEYRGRLLKTYLDAIEEGGTQNDPVYPGATMTYAGEYYAVAQHALQETRKSYWLLRAAQFCKDRDGAVPSLCLSSDFPVDVRGLDLADDTERRQARRALAAFAEAIQIALNRSQPVSEDACDRLNALDTLLSAGQPGPAAPRRLDIPAIFEACRSAAS